MLLIKYPHLLLFPEGFISHLFSRYFMSAGQGAGAVWQIILYLETDMYRFKSKILSLCYFEQICSLLMPQFISPENRNIDTSVAGLL